MIRCYFSASVFVIGSISGALVGGVSGEKLGRKKALLIDNIIMVLGNVHSLIENISMKNILDVAWYFMVIANGKMFRDELESILINLSGYFVSLIFFAYL